jgi:hypothetical protein
VGIPGVFLCWASYRRPDTIKLDALNPSQKECFVQGLHPWRPCPKRLCQGSPTRSRQDLSRIAGRLCFTYSLIGGDIAICSKMDAPGAIGFGILGRPGGKAIHIPVVHAKGCCNEHCVMNLKVCSSQRASPVHCFSGDVLAALLHLPGDGEESFKLGGDIGAVEIPLDIEDELLVAKVGCRRGAVATLAKMAVIQRRHVGRNQLALSLTEAPCMVQQDVGQLHQRRRGFGPKS